MIRLSHQFQPSRDQLLPKIARRSRGFYEFSGGPSRHLADGVLSIRRRGKHLHTNSVGPLDPTTSTTSLRAFHRSSTHALPHGNTMLYRALNSTLADDAFDRGASVTQHARQAPRPRRFASDTKFGPTSPSVNGDAWVAMCSTRYPATAPVRRHHSAATSSSSDSTQPAHARSSGETEVNIGSTDAW
jgi:hypothetical protein